MKTKLNDILECLKTMYKREGGIISAEIEYMLNIYFNNDTNKVNEILENWGF